MKLPVDSKLSSQLSRNPFGQQSLLHSASAEACKHELLPSRQRARNEPAGTHAQFAVAQSMLHIESCQAGRVLTDSWHESRQCWLVVDPSAKEVNHSKDLSCIPELERKSKLTAATAKKTCEK